MEHIRTTIALSTTLSLGSAFSRGQDVVGPDSILIGKVELPQVLLVGAFHFEYYDPDAHVTAKDERVNVKRPPATEGARGACGSHRPFRTYFHRV